MARKSVMVVDDEFLVSELLTAMLDDLGIEVCATAATAEDALALAKAHAPALVLMDVRLKGRQDGVEAAGAIQRAIDTQVIFITGSAEPATLARIGTAPVMLKPIRFDQFRAAVLGAIG